MTKFKTKHKAHALRKTGGAALITAAVLTLALLFTACPNNAGGNAGNSGGGGNTPTPTGSYDAESGAGQVGNVKFTMKKIEAVTGGTIGHSDQAAGSPPNPEHTITLSQYYLGETEVTQELYQAVMGNNPSSHQGSGKPPAAGEVQAKRPVEQMSWYDAIAFCNALTQKTGLGDDACVYWVDGHVYNADDAGAKKEPEGRWSNKGFRLPTEAEWEWAAQGGTNRHKWAGTNDGSTLADYAWYGDNSGNKTHEARKKNVNASGFFDMSGNVNEWCWDKAGNLPNPLPADYAGPVEGTKRIRRGGSVIDGAGGPACAKRVSRSPDIASIVTGIRVAYGVIHPAGVNYTVTFGVDGGHGTLTAEVDSTEIASPAQVGLNKTIVFTASPHAGYMVDTWTITGGQLLAGGQAGSSTAMVKITEPVTVAVSFKLKPPTTYTVIFGVEGTPPNGSISATYKAGGAAFTSGTAVAENTVLVFTASPATGYKVEKWTENGTTVPGNITNTYEHTVTKAADIRVSFVSSITIPDTFTLSNGAEYKVVDKAQRHVIMTKLENGSVSGVYTVAVTVEYSGVTYTLTGFDRPGITDFGFVTSLTAFALSGESAFLSVDDGVLFDKAKTKLIRYPKNKAGTSYTVPDGITVLGEYSFHYSKLTSVVLPTGLTTIEEYALSSCLNLQTVNLPSTLTSIENGLLRYCHKVEHIVFPEGITELPRDTLYECKGLKTLELPSTLTTTGNSFCSRCTALQSVTCKAATPPTLKDYAFHNIILAGVTLKVPAASVSAYQNAPIWKDFKKPFLTLP